MDPITQGVFGAIFAQSAVRDRDQTFAASVIGTLAGMAPDLDIFIRSETDPLLALQYHRHFTHALAFVPIGGLIASACFYPFVAKRMTFKQVYVFATLGWLSHALIDCCTSYGTQWLLPFSNCRVAWDNMSIIDPLYTIPLFLLAICYAVYRHPKILLGAWCLLLLYPLWGLTQRNRVLDSIDVVAHSRGHKVERKRALASLGNVLLWRGIYLYDGRVYFDGYRMPLGASPSWYPGDWAWSVKQEDLDLEGKETLAYDIERFDWFSGNWMVRLDEYPNILWDGRYGPLPNEKVFMWGAQMPDMEQDGHVQRVGFPEKHRSRSEYFQELWDMITGENPGLALPVQPSSLGENLF